MMLDILNQLSQLPDWLCELSDPERVAAALTYALPVLVGGKLHPEGVKPKRFSPEARGVDRDVRSGRFR